MLLQQQLVFQYRWTHVWLQSLHWNSARQRQRSQRQQFTDVRILYGYCWLHRDCKSDQLPRRNQHAHQRNTIQSRPMGDCGVLVLGQLYNHNSECMCPTLSDSKYTLECTTWSLLPKNCQTFAKSWISHCPVSWCTSISSNLCCEYYRRDGSTFIWGFQWRIQPIYLWLRDNYDSQRDQQVADLLESFDSWRIVLPAKVLAWYCSKVIIWQ